MKVLRRILGTLIPTLYGLGAAIGADSVEPLSECEQLKNDLYATEVELAALKKSHEHARTKLVTEDAELNRCRNESSQQKRRLHEIENQAKELEHRLQKEIAEGNLKIKRFSDRIVINMNDKILFPSGSAELRGDIRTTLDAIADILTKRENSRVMVEGHTDNVPIHTPQFSDNWDLSSRRAIAVLRRLLANRRLNPARFAVAGYGDNQPIAKNDSAAHRQLNRRVDIVLLLYEDIGVKP